MGSKFLSDREKLQKELVSELITAETSISNDSNSFKKLFECLYKKLPNNSYLSINPNNIEKRVDGICKKFNVSSQRALAAELRDKVTTYLTHGRAEDEEGREDKDLEYGVISFLLDISQNPVNKPYIPPIEEDEHSLEEELDWYKILVLDLDLEEESEEDWSSEGDELLSDEDEPYQYHSPLKVYKKQDELTDAIIPSYSDICGGLVKQYWRDYVTSEPISLLPYSQNVITPYYRVLTELQIIREIVSMLQGAPTSFVFYCEEGDVHLRENIATAHYSYEALNSALRYFHKKISMVQCLHYLCDDISQFISQPEHPYGSRTFQAFSCAIIMYLYQLNESLSEIEIKVKAQKEIVTMTALREAVREHFEIITVLYEMVQQILSEVVIDSPSVCVTSLINILFETVRLYESMGILTEHITKVLLTLLLCTLQPLLSTIDIWLAHGDLNNTTGELFLCRDPDIPCSSRDFWNAGLLYKESGLPKHKQIPSILMPLADKMLKAGKAIEMIKNLGKLGEPDVDLFAALIDKYLGTKIAFSSPTCKIISSPTNTQIPLEIDMLLLANFSEMSNDLQMHEDKTRTIYNDIWKNINKLHIIPSTTIMKTLIPLVDERCTEVSFSLLSHLRVHFQLDEHVVTLRKALLMEAGFPMAIFSREMYKELYKGEAIRDMTPFLRECLAPYTQFVTYIRMEHVSAGSTKCTELDPLLAVNITYTPPFPIDVVIHPELLTIYQNVFRLLLQINYAAWCIMPLSLMSYQNTTVSNTLHCFQFELANFIKVIQAYTMQRVLHCTGADMKKQLNTALELDEYVAIHKQYCHQMENYCLLTEDFHMFLGAVRRVLHEAVKFRRLWDSGELNDTKVEELMKTIKKCIQFVRNIVKTLNQTGIPQPHFAWLETALC